MVKQNFLTKMLLLCALIAGSSSVWATLPSNPLWKATALSDIADGATVIIISNSSEATNIALPSTTTSSSPVKIACTVSTNDGTTTITTPSGTTLQDLAWTIKKVTEGNNTSYKFYQEGSTTNRLYLNATNSNTSLRVGSSNSLNDQFVLGDLGKLLKVTTATRFVGPYDNNGSDWRTYNTENATNYKGAELTFYVLQTSTDPTSGFSFDNKTPSISFPATSTYTGLYTTASGYTGDISYELSDNTCGATINQTTGEVTVTKAGSVKVKGTAAAVAGSFSSSNDTYTLTVTDTREETELAYDEETQTVVAGEVLDAPELTNPNSLTGITYSSSDETVATVDEDGNVTGVAFGTAIITASFAGNSTYQPGSASYTITVTKAVPVGYVLYESFDTNNGTGGNDGNWSGNIATSNIQYDLEGWATDGAFGAKECVRTNKSCYLTSPALGVSGDVTLSFMMGAWGNDTNDGFVDIIGEGTFSTDNTGTLSNDNTTIKIRIEKSEWSTFTLKLKDVTAETKIKFYGASTKRIFLDEVVVFLDALAITPAKEYVSFSSPYPLDFTKTAGLTAYVVSAETSTSVTLTEVNKVPVNTGLVLKGTANTEYTVPVLSGDADTFTNKLKGTGTEGVTVEERSVYVLSDGKFKVYTGTEIAGGKAYLPKTSPAPSLSFDFGEGTTGIQNIERTINDNQYYTLDGRRVAEPTKGLYIINGKKVIIK